MFDRQTLEQYSLDMRQFIDFRQSTLPNGLRIVEAYNSSGLTFTLLPGRGLDIWTAHYNGKPLTWISQGSPFQPDFGQSWLRQFNGGLMTTCGLTHAGPPETDPITNEARDLHGKYSRLRAGDLQVSGGWISDMRYELVLSGVVCEATLFGEQLRLERSYEIELGKPSLSLRDHITNMGDLPTPLMVLYHINVGYPLVSPGTRLHIASEVIPRDIAAQAGIQTWDTYEAPSAGYAEQVFFHHVKHDHGIADALLANEDWGLHLAWETENLPYFTQWKNTRQGIYVSGIEPANCVPEGQNAAYHHGRLEILEAGQTKQFNWTLTVVDGAEALQRVRDEIAETRRTGTPVKGCKLDGFPK